MSYVVKTDDEILQDLALKFDLLRRSREIKDEDLASRGGTSRASLDKFRNNRGGISLKTFIRLLRGLGELDRLETLLSLPEDYSPTGKAAVIPVKRVRDKGQNKKKGDRKNSGFSWGDDR